MLVSPAPAQMGRPDHARAVAAGYKASFLCSNLFNGGLSEAQTQADDLQGTYPELNPLFEQLPATIDHERRVVRVRFSENMPPRIAAWRPSLGCAQLPIGAEEAAITALPQLALPQRDLARLDARPWPMGDRNATARARGDAAALMAATDRAFDRRTYGQGSETTAILVLQDGRIVAERYRGDFNRHTSQRTWSVAKSIAGTVVGAAAHQRLIDVNAPAPVRQWHAPGDPRAAITTDQLLRMASGLHSDHNGNRTDDLYFGGMAFSDQVAGFPLVARPGTHFRYANNDTVAAIHGLEQALGGGARALRFPFEALLWKIGMTRTVPETDWRGTFILSSQVWTTARDLARLGLLYQEDGVWNGERILPAGWVDYVRRHGPAQPARGFGYGAAWWTFPQERGIPEDAIIAQGNRGQYVVVVPSRRIVIVRRGFDRAGMAFDPLPFTRDVLDALR